MIDSPNDNPSWAQSNGPMCHELKFPYCASRKTFFSSKFFELLNLGYLLQLQKSDQFSRHSNRWVGDRTCSCSYKYLLWLSTMCGDICLQSQLINFQTMNHEHISPNLCTIRKFSTPWRWIDINKAV